MTRGKLGFPRLKRAVIAGIEARTAEVVVGLSGKAIGRQIGAPRWPSAQTGVSTLRAHRRKGTFAQVGENRSDKFSIRYLKITAFAAFACFHGLGWRNCRRMLRLCCR